MARIRKFSRLLFHTASTLTLDRPAKSFRTRLIDISLKGALLEKPDELVAESGEPVLLRIHLDDSDVSIVMNTEVAHIDESRLGLHCLAIDMDSMIHLRRLMELNFGDPELLERELFSLGQS